MYLLDPELDLERMERALQAARALGVRADHVRDRMAELERWARVAGPRPARTPWRWTAPALLAAAAAVAFLWYRAGADRVEAGKDEQATLVTPIGSQVVIVTGPGTRYAVLASSPFETELRVEAGAVTARLYPGAAPHRLRILAGSVEAVATGTIFTVAISAPGEPYVIVHEGSVSIQDGATLHSAGPREAWPPHRRPPGLAFDDQVAVLRRRPAPQTQADANAEAETEGSLATGAAPTAAGPPDGSPARPHPHASPVDEWRRARLLRGQGNYTDALTVLAELADGGDPVWAPIALVETMRIFGGPMNQPADVIPAGEQFFSRYAAHGLAREATELYCQATAQLGHRSPRCR